MISTVLAGAPWLVPAAFVAVLVAAPLLGRLLLRRRRLAWTLFAVSALVVAGLVLLPDARDGAAPGCTASAALPFDTANVLLFVPPVLLAAVASRRPVLAFAGGVAGSAAIEVVQLLIPAIGRRCDTSDLVANALGAAIGATLALIATGSAARGSRPLRRWGPAVAGALVLMAVAVTAILVAPLPAAASTIDEPGPAPAAEPRVDFPDYGASAVGLDDGTAVVTSGSRGEGLPIASITKVVTALVVLDRHPLAPGEEGPVVTMRGADVAAFGRYLEQEGTVVDVREGWRFTQRDLLELTLVTSANNYASSLARWAFGSESAFVAAAERWLAEQGFRDTVIAEPTGLSPDDVSTTTELVELGRLALADPVVAELVATDSIDPPHLPRLEATNDLLGRQGVDGIKTGTLGDRVNLLFSSTFDVDGRDVGVVGVVLGGPGPDRVVLDRDVLRLLASVEAGFREVELVAAGGPVGAVRTPWGQSARAVASDTLVARTWGGAAATPSVGLDEVTLARRGDRVGTLEFDVGGRRLAVPVVLDAPLTDPGPIWRLTHPDIAFS